MFLVINTLILKI